MGWGNTFAAAIGGGLQAGAEALGTREKFKLEREKLSSDEKIAKLREDIRMMIADANNNTKLKISEAKNRTLVALQELADTNRLDVKRLENEGEAYVQELVNKGWLDREEAAGINRINVAKEVAAGNLKVAQEGTRRAVSVANIHGNTARDVANINGQTARDTTGMRVGEDQRQFDLTFPLDIYSEETERMNASRPRAGLFTDETTQPSFRPTAPLPQPPARQMPRQAPATGNPAGFMVPDRGAPYQPLEQPAAKPPVPVQPAAPSPQNYPAATPDDELMALGNELARTMQAHAKAKGSDRALLAKQITELKALIRQKRGR
jgi:hypothetical protein